VSFLLLTPHPLETLGLGGYSEAISADRGQHAVIFVCLALFGAASRWPVSRTILGALLAAYAVGTEGLQSFIPSRTPEWADVGENMLGIAIGFGLCAVWARIRRPRDTE
jgi:VanZ family protein